MKYIRTFSAFALAALLAMALISCQKTDNKNAASNQPDNRPAVNNGQTTNAVTPATTDAPANSNGTPTDAYKAAYAARKNKDVPGLKKLMSKDIIEFFTEIGGLGEKKQTLDELLMDLCEKPQAPSAETRNEKVTGDTATVEYLDETGDWSSMDFIKEDGGWKLTIAKPEKGDIKVDSNPKGKSNK